MESKNGPTWPIQSEKKEYNFELRYAQVAPEVWHALKNLPRTGWVDRGVKNPESVAEHTTGLRKLVLENREELKEFSDAEIQDLLDMLEVHDWAESKPEVGDQVIVWQNEEEKKRLKEAKFKQEHDAMVDICRNLGEDGERIFSLWLRYAEKKDPIAIFAKQADKYQAMERAFEYESRGEKVSTTEFIKHDEDIIEHPFFVKRVAELKKKVESLNSNEISWPVEENQEKKKGVVFEPEYFNIEIEFAKAVAQKTQRELTDVLIDHTDFFRRFGLGQKPNPEDPRWQEYIKGIKDGKNISELSYEFYLNKPERAQEKKEQKTGQLFGPFKYDYKDGTVHLHFVSTSQDNITKTDSFKSDLAALFESVKREHPEAKLVEARSWLLGTSIPRKFLPESYIDNAELLKENFQAGSRWGQFVDHSGKIKTKYRDKFLANLKDLDPNNLSKVFPIQTYQAEGSVEDFYKFYGIKDGNE